MIQVPILIIAYNRPRSLGRLLMELETLNTRRVFISIDGPMSESQLSNQQVFEKASDWKSLSRHEVTVVHRERNLGIYDHLPKAMSDFFASNACGIILEDDIEFVPNFFDFVDRHYDLLKTENLWSICGHNPAAQSNPLSDVDLQLTFRTSFFHSIWGWATSKENAEIFLENYHLRIDLNEAFLILERTSRRITRDPLLQRAFVLTWMRKLSGWNIRRKLSGWDTRWAYEGWKAGKLSLLPDISLSRECLDQSEGQTHKHETVSARELFAYDTKAIFEKRIADRSAEIKRMRTWGISRRYSWFYAKRITRQLKEFIQ
jgi:hypothetical protein